MKTGTAYANQTVLLQLYETLRHDLEVLTDRVNEIDPSQSEEIKRRLTVIERNLVLIEQQIAEIDIGTMKENIEELRDDLTIAKAEIENLDDDISAIKQRCNGFDTAIQSLQNEDDDLNERISNLASSKQDKLIPGTGITIRDNVISATGGGGSETVVEIVATASVDGNVGTPSVQVLQSGDRNQNITFAFHNLKGETGQRGADGTDGKDGLDGKDGQNGENGLDGITPEISATASVDNTSENPTVTVTRSGTDASPTFNFEFSGIKGKDGVDGQTGERGSDGLDGKDGVTPVITATASVSDTTGTPACEVVKSGPDETPNFAFNFSGLKQQGGGGGGVSFSRTLMTGKSTEKYSQTTNSLFVPFDDDGQPDFSVNAIEIPIGGRLSGIVKNGNTEISCYYLPRLVIPREAWLPLLLVASGVDNFPTPYKWSKFIPFDEFVVKGASTTAQAAYIPYSAARSYYAGLDNAQDFDRAGIEVVFNFPYVQKISSGVRFTIDANLYINLPQEPGTIFAFQGDVREFNINDNIPSAYWLRG